MPTAEKNPVALLDAIRREVEERVASGDVKKQDSAVVFTSTVNSMKLVALYEIAAKIESLHISLRDQFAMAALSAILETTGGTTLTSKCKVAYQIADSMLKARQTSEKK